MKAFRGWIVGMFAEEEMVVRILSSQRMELDFVARQVDVGANQAVAPQGAQSVRVSEHRGRTGVAGHAHEDHGSFQGLLQVGSPVLREGSSRRGRPQCEPRVGRGELG